MVEPVATSLQVWGKGFRISERSEEFQLLVPPSREALAETEFHLAQLDWGGILRPLYKLDDDGRRKQFWLGVAGTSITVVFIEGSKDRHNRRSIVAVGATTPVNWNDVDLQWVVSRTAALARRFVRTIAATLQGAPEHLQHQLKNGTFLPERNFELHLEVPDSEYEWKVICQEIRKWRGVTGIATRHLIGLGGNVLCGTKEELEGVAVAGLLEHGANEIVPITKELEIWGELEAENVPEKRPDEPLRRIDDTLREIRDEQRELRAQNARLERRYQETHMLVESAYRLMQNWFDVWTGRRR